MGTSALRAHICTLTERQREFGYEEALRAGLLARGFALAPVSADALPKKLSAVSESQLCVLLLGPDLGPRHPLSSFSDTELEACAARDSPHTQMLIFAEESSVAAEPEQAEFIDRMSSFISGEFRSSPVSTPQELSRQLERALRAWRPARVEETSSPRFSPDPGAYSRSVLISSAGDESADQDTMGVRRATARTILRSRNYETIDYLLEPSQDYPSLTLVMAWARECRLLVLILGQRYGTVSPLDGLGITELEFVTAYNAGRPILAFIGIDAIETSDLDERQFVARVKALLPEENVVQFAGPSQLEQLLHRQIDWFEAGSSCPSRPARAVSAEQARSWYGRQTERWLGRVSHLSRPELVPLREVFVALETLPQEGPGAADPRIVFSDDHRIPAHYSLRTIVPIPVDTALERYGRLVIRGDPGAGKSLTLRWYAVDAPDGVIPIYVRLAGYAAAFRTGEVTSLLAYIHREERRLILTSPGDQSPWSQGLEQGNARLLLDALDEVPADDQERVAREIDELAGRLSLATRIVVTTRIAGVTVGLGDRFVVTQLQPLRRHQQRELMEKWLMAAHRDESDVAAATPARVQRLVTWLDREPRLAEWTRVPQLLTFLAALSDGGGDQDELPTTKAQVYRRVVRLMLTRWSALNVREFGRHIGQKEAVMLDLARRNVLEGQGEIITIEGFRQAVKAAAGRYQLASGTLPPDEILGELTQQDGVLIAVGEGLYSFQHPTLPEYLAATLVAARPQAERSDLLARKRLHARWEEVTEFCVSELDRLEQYEAADGLIRDLIHADAQPVYPYSWRDPLRLALVRAARCQGGRNPEHANPHLSAHLISTWWRIWRRAVTDFRAAYLLQSAEQAFRALGPLADPIVRELGSIIREQPPRSSFYNFALQALSAAGVAAAPVAEELRQALHDPDRAVQCAAALALGGLGEAAEPALDDLCLLFDDPDITDDSSSAFRAITGFGNFDGDTNRYVVSSKLIQPPGCENTPASAANALMRLGNVSVRAHEKLRQIWPGLNAYGQAQALRVLGSQWTDASASLETFRLGLQDDDPAVVFNAASAAGCLGPAAAPLVNDLLKVVRQTLGDADGTGEAHWAAIWAIRELGYEAAPILDDLRYDLEHSNLETRRDVLFLLEQMGPVKLPLLGNLRAALSDKDAEVRWSAANSVGSLGPAAAGACGDLAGALAASEISVRIAACQALASLGKEALPAWDALVRVATNDSQERVRGAALVALTKLGGSADDPTAVTLLRQQLKNAEEEVRATVIQAIAAAERANASLRADLFEALTDNDPRVRTESVKAVGRISGPVEAALAAFRQTTNEPDADGARDADAIFEEGIIEPLRHLRSAIHDADKDVRSAAVEGIGTLNSAAQSLITDLRAGPDDASGLTAKLEAIAAAVRRDLRQIAHDPDDPLKVQAASSLRRCGADEALSVIEDLCPLLGDHDMSQESGGPGWAQQTIGKLSPFGQPTEDIYLPHDEASKTIAEILTGTEDAGWDPAGLTDHADVTQDRHRVSLDLALFLDRANRS